MKIRILGSQGWMPAENQQTCCILIEYKNKLIMLDAGTGVSNLALYKSVLKNYKEIHVVFSHYHIDHTVGVSYFSRFFSDKNIFFYGPGKPFYADGVHGALDALLSPQLFSRRPSQLGTEVRFIDYSQDFFIDDIKVIIREQRHTDYSFGLMLDDKLYYATDTTADQETFMLARNARLLLHECWDIQKSKKLHSSLDEIKALQSQHACHIVLIHKNPDIKICEYEKELIDSEILLAKDNMLIEI